MGKVKGRSFFFTDITSSAESNTDFVAAIETMGRFFMRWLSSGEP